MTETIDALVIGGGPAGLMAAEEMARAGLSVTVAEAKQTLGRKFLMAGKSGLNLTKDEDPTRFVAAIGAPYLAPALAAFGPDAVRRFAEGLGQAVFTGSSGRVFPVAMKGSPLLRAWLRRLDGLGVQTRTGWRWTGWNTDGALTFRTAGGAAQLQARCAVLALGGASWSRLGSDGAWVPILAAKGVDIAPFRPANVALSVAWSAPMQRQFGQPLKPVALTAGDRSVRGECVIGARGLEGSAVYALSPVLRDGAALSVDLCPDLDAPALATRLARLRSNDSVTTRLRKLGLSPAAVALVMECARDRPFDTLKKLVVPHQGVRPMDEAISVAGGIRADALDAGLQLRALPGVFAAGEMLDWEAPTGGYLLTACLATGRWAGRAAAGSDPAGQ